MSPIRVLVSHRRPRATTNPYIETLARHLDAQPDIELSYFSFVRALLGRYDLFHAHWPEVMMTSHRPSRQAAREFLTAAFVTRLWLTRTPVVRTVHNLERPSGLNRRQAWLLDRFDARTVRRIALNPRTAETVEGPMDVILHGDYSERYALDTVTESIPGRIGYFGLVRRYKGVDTLVRAFLNVSDDALSLRISGSPSSTELARDIEVLAANDPRVSTHWAFLTDRELARAVTENELVVLPYRHMHNSGAALTALSLHRPVLVPDTPVNQDLRAEVGAGWVMTFTGELSARDLESALAESRMTERTTQPDLSGRAWSLAGPAHAETYRRALESRHAR